MDLTQENSSCNNENRILAVTISELTRFRGLHTAQNSLQSAAELAQCLHDLGKIYGEVRRFEEALKQVLLQELTRNRSILQIVELIPVIQIQFLSQKLQFKSKTRYHAMLPILIVKLMKS